MSLGRKSVLFLCRSGLENGELDKALRILASLCTKSKWRFLVEEPEVQSVVLDLEVEAFSDAQAVDLVVSLGGDGTLIKA